MKVAIQGYEGSFHDIVARQYFGEQIEIVPCDTFREVARQVLTGESDRGVMAIENSIAGSIIANYNILQNENLQVAGEAVLMIRQNLLALPGVAIDDIGEVHSHHMAFLQCSDFLDSHPHLRWVETEDTALSAKLLARDGDRHRGVIASTLAAQLFGLNLLCSDIHTIKNNYTRFMILKPFDRTMPPDADKASLYFKAEHRRGALLEVMKQMEDSSINLTKLQSYPIPTEPWHYLFHVDMEFDTLHEYVEMLDRLQRTAQSVHVYGVYRHGETYYG